MTLYEHHPPPSKTDSNLTGRRLPRLILVHILILGVAASIANTSREPASPASRRRERRTRWNNELKVREPSGLTYHDNDSRQILAFKNSPPSWKAWVRDGKMLSEQVLSLLVRKLLQRLGCLNNDFRSVVVIPVGAQDRRTKPREKQPCEAKHSTAMGTSYTNG